jgi:hypothetical protein
MGLWGIFIGPIVASCLFALVQIFNTELKEMAQGRAAVGASPVPPPPEPSIQDSSAQAVVTAPQPAATPSSRLPSPSKHARKRRR